MKLIFSLCLLMNTSVIADDWGQLFFTPAERINRVRPASAPAASAVAPAQYQARFYNGRLETPRQQLHWIDGQVAPVPQKHKPGEILHTPTDQ